MRQARRWILLLSVAAVIGAVGCYLEQSASQVRQGNMVQLAPTSFDGLYGEETSTTLPGVHNGKSRTYHWTKPESQFTLWPAIATGSIIELEYLNPLGPVLLYSGTDPPVSLASDHNMRRLHLLLPAGVELTIRLVQTMPQMVESRQLGLIISNVEWSALGITIGAADMRTIGRLLLGLPLTLAMLWALGWVLRLPSQGRMIATLFALLVMAILSMLSPWDARAVQPALQLLLGAAIVGGGLVYLLRHVVFLNWAAIIICGWGLSLLLFFSPYISADGVGYYAYVRSAFIDGDLNFTNEFDPQQSPFAHTPQIIPAPRPGYLVNYWSIGPALFWTPFWLLGHALAQAGQLLGLGWRADGYDLPYIFLIALCSALAGLLTILGCFRICMRWFPPGVAALASLTVYLGSNLVFYAQLAGSFAHSLSAATVTWFILAALRLDESPTLRGWLLLGLSAGAMLVTYWVTALLLIIPLCIVIRRLFHLVHRNDRSGLIQLAVGVLAAGCVGLVVVMPQLAVWKILFGSWLAIPQGSHFATPQQSRIVEVLFGPLYGIAWWTPAYFTGLVGGLWFALRRPWPGVIFLGTITLYLMYNASLPDWHGGGAFGMRRLISLTPLLAVGLAMLFSQAQRWRPLPAIVASALIIWTIGLMLRYVSYQIPHQPYEIRDLGLRAILLSPDPFPFGALLRVLQESWFGTLLRRMDMGSLLILGVCLSGATIVALLWHRYNKRVSPSLSYTRK